MARSCLPLVRMQYRNSNGTPGFSLTNNTQHAGSNTSFSRSMDFQLRTWHQALSNLKKRDNRELTGFGRQQA
jgi:hypothetical protein